MGEHIDDDDITSASQGLRRVQQFYQIPASHMAAGRYNDRIIGDEINGKFRFVFFILCSVLFKISTSKSVRLNLTLKCLWHKKKTNKIQKKY